MRLLILAAALFALAPPAYAAEPAELPASPEEQLDRVDAELIATAKTSIDFAGYVLTDRLVIDALNAAEARGAVVRIVLDPRERHDFVRLGDLSDNVRVKRGGPFMHESLRDRRRGLANRISQFLSLRRKRSGQRSGRHSRRERGGEVRGAFRNHVERGGADDRVWAGDRRAGAALNARFQSVGISWAPRSP